MLRRLFDGLRKTREIFGEGLKALLAIGRDLDEPFLDRLEEVLYTADLGSAASPLVEEVRRAYKRREIKTTGEVLPFLRAALLRRLEGCGGGIAFASSGPTVVLVAGVNGSGKTTTIAKLARHLQAEGKSVILAAGDTFRAAAVEQLTIWAERLGVPIVKGAPGGDPAAVAFDAAEAALARDIDVLVVDTAGRLHTQRNLMEELRKIRRVLAGKVPGAPHETLLVLDATTGQNALVQSEVFREAIEVSGIVLAKLDGTAKGGAVFGIRERLGVPVKFVGLGEGLDDLERFDPASFVEAILEPAVRAAG
ncbi:MAG TPA: signal recognition particle-docking protein FtsY [Planctomycetota bacterium]|nr:signal recognition particle-docking protein FtsY [Planctomycetota bacterium]